MKKIKFLAIALIGFSLFSCSVEETTTFADSPEQEFANSTFSQTDSLSSDDVSKLYDMAVEMAASQEYIQYRSAVRDFALKMNKIYVPFETSADVSDWMDLNLSSTQFTSGEEAISMFNEIQIMAEDNYDARIDLFSGITAGTPAQLEIILEPIHTDPPAQTVTTGCHDDCYDWGDMVFAILDNQHNAMLAAAETMGGKGVVIAWLADWRYESAFGYAVEELNFCIGMCDE